MQIKTTFPDNILPEKFGKKAHEDDVLCGNPVRSFSFEVTDIPEGTNYLAWSLLDYDAVPVCAFPWIHWLVVDVPVAGSAFTVAENASVLQTENLTQGKNSFSSQLLGADFSEIETFFVGPTPPDKDHRYELKVYALSDKTSLENGFYFNEFRDSLENITLAKTKTVLIGKV